jgi:hypothetical protein
MRAVVSLELHAEEDALAVRLHRCSVQWSRHRFHPCWAVEKALRDAGIEYERVPGPVAKGKRDVMVAGTGQRLYPAIEFEDGTWYREESREMVRTIAEGRLRAKAGS